MTDEQVPEDDWLVRGDADPQEVAARYDAWAAAYDADLDAWSYRAPGVVADTVAALDPPPREVLDIGCGTGLAGRTLRARGFTGRLVGLDISAASLAVAQQSGSYDDLRPADLQQRLPVDDDDFGALVCVGVMTYLPDVEATWREFARAVRPGGHVVFTQREDLWEPRACQEVVDRLAREGVWTAVEVTGPEPYLPESEGALAALGCHYVTLRVS